MNGINGFVQFNSLQKKEEIGELIKSMNQNSSAFNKEENKLIFDNDFGLGGPEGNLLSNKGNSLCIAFCGRIYNSSYLKEMLQSKKHSFNFSNHAELVLHCFEEFGTASFSMLEGMYSFAVYDLTKRTLYIVRDRAGEKPLFYYKTNGFAVFGSSLKSIVSTRLADRNISKTALCQYLQLTYIPSPLTIFENILKLPPGHYMEIRKNGAVKINQYWDVIVNSNSLIKDYRLAKRKLRETLFNAVEACMDSTYPLGCFLSGGTDSTIVTGIMSKLSNRPIDTFTIGYKMKQFDESKRTNATAKLHKTRHHILYLEYENALPELTRILNNFDEPFADSSSIPTYMVAKYASQYVDTVLTGDASDQLFAGLNKYLIGHYAKLYKNLPPWLRKSIIEKVIYSLPDKSILSRKMRKIIYSADVDFFEQIINLTCLGFKNKELNLLLNEKMISEDGMELYNQYYSAHQGISDELSRTLYADYKVGVEGDLLCKVRNASRLNSVEARFPYVRTEVVELAASFPIDFKLQNKKTKIILKETFNDLLPKEVLQASKHGFAVPIGHWFRNELKNDLLQAFSQDFVDEQGIFNLVYINRILNEHFTFSKDRSSELWLLYVFQKWYQNFMITEKDTRKKIDTVAI